MTQSYPLSWPQGWPRTPAHHRRFNWQLKNSTFGRAREQLADELRRLGAEHTVLSTNLNLRLDGQPYATDAGKKITDPGVAVYFQLRGKSMSMARDAYDNPAQNLRSLAMAVEHLRGLERHGGAQMMERAFSGFTELPPPDRSDDEPTLDWRFELGPIPQDQMEQWELLALMEARYRKKAKTIHSDMGGDDTAMIRLNAAIAQARKDLNQ